MLKGCFFNLCLHIFFIFFPVVEFTTYIYQNFWHASQYRSSPNFWNFPRPRCILYIFQVIVQNKPIALTGCFLTCVYIFFSSGKIHYTEIFDMLRNIDPPLGFGKKCPERLAYKKLIRMNMPMDFEGKVRKLFLFASTSAIQNLIYLHFSSCKHFHRVSKFEQAIKIVPFVEKKSLLFCLFPTLCLCRIVNQIVWS